MAVYTSSLFDNAPNYLCTWLGALSKKDTYIIEPNINNIPDNKIGFNKNGTLLFTFVGSVSTVDGNSLVFPSVSRAHVGEYLCIASNGVPPSISKRIVLRVQCKKKIFKIVFRFHEKNLVE